MPDHPKKRHAVNVRDTIAPVIKSLSEAERRNFSQQVHILLEEALIQRDTQNSVNKVISMLKALSIQDLALVLEAVSKLIRHRLIQINTPFVQLLKQHESQILSVWRTFPGGEVQLAELLLGKKPTEHDLGLLQAASGLSYEEIVEAYNNTFTGEHNCNGECNTHESGKSC